VSPMSICGCDNPGFFNSDSDNLTKSLLELLEGRSSRLWRDWRDSPARRSESTWFHPHPNSRLTGASCMMDFLRVHPFWLPNANSARHTTHYALFSSTFNFPLDLLLLSTNSFPILLNLRNFALDFLEVGILRRTCTVSTC